MLTWVLESDMFPDAHPALRSAILRAGQSIVDWSDDWMRAGAPAELSAKPTVFHGSLGSAAYVQQYFDWVPGSFCDAGKFYCSAWYDEQRSHLIHRRYRFTTVAKLVENPAAIAASVGAADSIFVRPDSPLKPFSGRVVEVAGLTPKTLDHGFYYDDLQLPVVVAPVQKVGREWRFVVIERQIVAGSGYDAATRSAVPLSLEDSASAFAASIAAQATGLCDAYILDVCDCAGELRLMEFNPFGGADLYACDPEAVVRAMTRLVVR